MVYFYFSLYDKFVYDGKFFFFSLHCAVLCCVRVPVVIRKRKMFSCLPYYRDDLAADCHNVSMMVELHSEENGKKICQNFYVDSRCGGGRLSMNQTETRQNVFRAFVLI